MLEIQNLSISFSSYTKGLKRHTVRAIDCLDLKVQPGQIIAVVGQSGAGKSLLAHAVLGILPKNASVRGNIFFRNNRLSPQIAQSLRGREIALIPQSISFLNPLLHVGTQIARAGFLSGMSCKDAKQASLEALRRYGLSSRVTNRFPFQLSGGMARRVLTATATIGSASLLFADEPTNGLDRNTAQETLSHLRQIADTGKAVVLITHDIHLALQVADKVSVFYGGVTIEEANACDFTDGTLRHPYSKILWASLPCNQFTTAIPALSVGHASYEGCPFSANCLQHTGICGTKLPELRPLRAGRVRCWNA